MADDFRKKTFRGAKIEDLIVDFDSMAKQCEEQIKRSNDPGRQRFFEGMSIAYTTVSLKLRGAFQYMDPNVLDEVYNQVAKTDMKQQLIKQDADKKEIRACSFCGKAQNEVKHLVPGPGVAICDSCLDFGKQIIEEKDEG